MKKSERIAAMVPKLKAWQAHGRALYDAQGAAYKAIGSTFDSPFWDAIFDTWRSYTAAVAELVGDEEEWLEWFDVECDLGRRPKLMRFASGKEVRVRTVQQLARVIVG